MGIFWGLGGHHKIGLVLGYFLMLMKRMRIYFEVAKFSFFFFGGGGGA